MTMSGKKMEGNEQAKRKNARQARAQGKAPSEVQATTGASKQREHLGGNADHVEKITKRREGKPDQIQDQRQQTDTPRQADLRSRAEEGVSPGHRDPRTGV